MRFRGYINNNKRMQSVFFKAAACGYASWRCRCLSGGGAGNDLGLCLPILLSK